MALAQRRWAANLLYFWFHELSPADWWGGSQEVDRECEKRFRPELEALSSLRPENFVADPQVALAAVLLFDQMPRNIYRGTARAFAFDPLARDITHYALDFGCDLLLPPRRAQFLAMPLMHSEDIADQLRSLEAFRRIRDGSNLSFARSHYRMIARFGRFPHRNDILERKTTPAEQRAIDAGFSW
ncbi:DUF924 family protein [Aurantiacibacter sediminis]|uniref:DUF924 domain-containing protein n=1 Tax=Aurantiacibacter sediminis TaxID=2793064 RepID=A0ABS0MZK1_9SPHN|nr:DUF924 family protein [Aurantiacibacter sediminis]MBH5321143.1 DUF924 domain-containing protein [Aurantiacibacter sediminis]